MRLVLSSDIGAPIAVTAVDLISETVAPDWNEWLAYISAVGGYGLAVWGVGGDMALKYGIASLPWAAKKIYNRARGWMPAASKATTRVTRYPASATQTNFQGVRLV